MMDNWGSGSCISSEKCWGNNTEKNGYPGLLVMYVLEAFSKNEPLEIGRAPHGPWAKRALGPMGPNGPWAQTAPGPKRALGPNGLSAQWAQMGRAKWTGPGWDFITKGEGVLPKSVVTVSPS